MTGQVLAWVVVGFFVVCTGTLVFLAWLAPELEDDTTALAETLGDTFQDGNR